MADYPPPTGGSVCRSSPPEAFDDQYSPFTTSSGGM
jgi:hypothetical protein